MVQGSINGPLKGAIKVPLSAFGGFRVVASRVSFKGLGFVTVGVRVSFTGDC